jgi:carnosine N-methyltransferase
MYAFLSYKERALADLDRWRALYKNVSRKQKGVLERRVKYTAKLDGIEERIFENGMLCKSIVASAMEFYDINQREVDEHIAEAKKADRKADKVSVTQTLKHFVRDWADEGAKERNDGFPCVLGILEQVKREMGREGDEKLKVLLPGAGLGRLSHEVEALGGVEVTINEWSSYMNMAYRYLLSAASPDSSMFHPFVDSLSHHASTADLLRAVSFPNVSPSGSVLLIEGDFTNPALFSDGGHYDVIVTYFFIDTARNLLSYFEAIHRLLRQGGFWINFGPLLYGTGPFVQLSLDEVLELVEEMGFEFLDIGHEKGETSGGDVENMCGELTFEQGKVRWREAEYGFNARALTKNAYRAQTWLARKQ